MAHTTNTISAPVRLEQDVWPVLGVSGGLGYVIANANISKAAKYKPFRSSAKSFANDTARDNERESALYGISGVPNISIDNQGNLGNVNESFAYNNPRGSSYNEMFRLLDLVNYKHDSVFGFKLTTIDEGLYYDSVNTAQLHIGTGDLDPRYDWRCLSPIDLHANFGLGDYYVGIILCCHGYANEYFLSSGYTLSQFGNGDVKSVLFAGQQISGAGVQYALVPDLYNWRGQNVTIAGALANGCSSPTTVYKIGTDISASAIYSFEFERNIDRIVRQCTNNPHIYDMSKLSCSMSQTPSGILQLSGDYAYYTSLSNLRLELYANNGFSGNGVTLYSRLSISVEGGAFTGSVGGEFVGNIETHSQYATFRTGNTWYIDHIFSSIANKSIAKIYNGLRSGVMHVSLLVSTNSDGTGGTASFNFTVNLGTWSY